MKKNVHGMLCCNSINVLKRFFKIILMGSWKVFAMVLMEGIYVVAQASAVITMSGSTFQPSSAIISKNGCIFKFFW